MCACFLGFPFIFSDVVRRIVKVCFNLKKIICIQMMAEQTYPGQAHFVAGNVWLWWVQKDSFSSPSFFCMFSPSIKKYIYSH